MERKKVITAIVFILFMMSMGVKGYIDNEAFKQMLVNTPMQGKIQRLDYLTRGQWRIVYEQDDKRWQEYRLNCISFAKEHSIGVSDSISKSANDDKVYFYKLNDGQYLLHCIYEIW
jgi:hypothetical protein